MAKARKRKKRTQRGLGGTSSAAVKRSPKVTQKQVGLAMLSFIGGAIIGAGFGKLSGPVGLGTAGVGIWKQNLNLASFGAGMLVVPSIQTTVAQHTPPATNGVEGFDLKTFAESAKERTKAYLQNVGQKFLPPASEEASTNGLNGGEQVTYFVNPYTQQEDTLDLSLMEKEQERIAQMAGTVGDIDPTERNF